MAARRTFEPAAVRDGESAVPGGMSRVWQSARSNVWSPERLRRERRHLRGVARARLTALLRLLEQPPCAVAGLEERRPGDIVRIAGKAVPLQATQGQRRFVWWTSGRQDRDEPLVETAHDFMVDDGSGELARVEVAGGYLMETTHLRAGEPVTVLGTYDRALDASAGARHPRGAPTRAVLRAGRDVPLLVWVLV